MPTIKASQMPAASVPSSDTGFIVLQGGTLKLLDDTDLPSSGGSADATVTGTDDATADLAALNAAITAVSASATAPKTIAIVGTFAMGATRPSQLQYITLDLTRAYMKQTANFTDAAPWLRGTGMNIIGGKFGTSLGAVGVDNSIQFGDTATAGDGPCGNISGFVFDATWDILVAARTVISYASTSTTVGRVLEGASLSAYASDLNIITADDTTGIMMNLSGNWQNITIGGDTCVINIAKITGAFTLSGNSNQVNIGGDVGSVSITGLRNVTKIGYVTGAYAVGGNNSSHTAGWVGAATLTATTSSFDIGHCNSTVSTASSDGCSFTFGTVNGVLTASGTDGAYNIGTLVAASQVLSGANNTYNIGEVSSSITCSGSGSSYKISLVSGTLSCSGDDLILDVSQAASAVTVSGDRMQVSIAECSSTFTTSSNPQASVFRLGRVVGNLTTASARSVWIVGNAEGATATLTNTTACVLNFGYFVPTTVTGPSGFTDCVMNIGATNQASAVAFDIGTRNSISIGGVSGTTATTTFNNGTASRVSMASIGDGADCVIAATCDACMFSIAQTGGSASTTVTGGASNNVVNVISDVPPTFTTTAAACENIVYWQQYSTSVNYPQVLVSYKGPNRAARPITLADINALGASVSAQMAFFDLPATKRVTRAFVLNMGTDAATAATLTASMGPTGTPTAILTANSVFTANTFSDTLGATLTQSYTAGTAIVIEFVANVNLNTVTGLTNGLVAVLEWA